MLVIFAITVPPGWQIAQAKLHKKETQKETQDVKKNTPSDTFNIKL